jgi:acetolactate synthase-1/2/3 large subunit
MGFSFAASVGAYLAGKEKGQTVCVIGDGGMNMNIQELQTLNTFNLKPKVFILNNHIYGITKAYQKTNFNGRMEACGPIGYTPPDFIKIAKAYGIKTFSIKSNSLRHIKSTINKVLEFDGPVVCDINCHEYHTYQPRVFGWKTPIEEMYPYLDREEAKTNMSIDVTENFYNLEYPNVE